MNREERRQRAEARIAGHTETIRRLAAQGLTDLAIAQAMGMSRMWVWTLRGRAKIPPGFRRGTRPRPPRPRGPFDLRDTEEL